MVARLNDLPAAPAFEDAASALAPGGVSWPPFGVQKLPIAGGRAGARSFRVVRADRPSACGNCGNRGRPRRSTPGGVSGPLYGVQKLPVVGGRVGARSFRVVRADRRSACGNCGNRSRQRCSPPGGVSWPPCGVQKLPIASGRGGARSFRVVGADGRSGCGNCGNQSRPRRSHPIASRASMRSARIRGRRRARQRNPVFVLSALIGETPAGIAQIRAVRRSPQTVVRPGR